MMTAQNTENESTVDFEHQNPVKAFAFLWARDNAMLTAMTICDDLAAKIESEVEGEVVKGRFGLTYGDWWIPYRALHQKSSAAQFQRYSKPILTSQGMTHD